MTSKTGSIETENGFLRGVDRVGIWPFGGGRPIDCDGVAPIVDGGYGG